MSAASVPPQERRALAFADRLASRCTDALGPAVLSVILHGSLTLGDFTPGHSDIDLLVIVEHRLSDDQLAALRHAVDAVRTDAPRRVDLRVVTRASAGSPTPAPAMEAALALRPGKALDVETGIAEPDLVPEFSVARAHGRSLVGRAPEEVIAPVPEDLVTEVGDRQLALWQGLTDDAAHAELMVLSACRIWRFAVERVHCSKAAAGRWALERDPSLRAIEEEGIGRILGLVRQELNVTAP